MVVDFGGEHEFVPEPLQVNAQNLQKRRAIRNSSSKSSNRFFYWKSVSIKTVQSVLLSYVPARTMRFLHAAAQQNMESFKDE